MGHRESERNKEAAKRLPLSDDVDYKSLQTETACWRQEERRLKTLRDFFNIVSFNKLGLNFHRNNYKLIF